MLKRVVNVLVALWMCIVNACRFIIGKKRDSNRRTHTQQSISQISQYNEWTTDWDGWEGVKIENTSPSTEQATPTSVQDVPDLFKDMEPNFQKTKKIKVKQNQNRNYQPNLKQFAVDPNFKNTTVELLDWPDEEEGMHNSIDSGWEKDEELPELLRQSRQVLRQQRLEAMEAQKKALQQQKLSGNTQPILGATKIT